MSTVYLIFPEQPGDFPKIKVYGLTLTERLFRQLKIAGAKNIFILGDNIQGDLSLPVQTLVRFENWKEHLRQFSADDIYLVDAHAIIDDRLIRFIFQESVSARIRDISKRDFIFVKLKPEEVHDLARQDFFSRNELSNYLEQMKDAKRLTEKTVKNYDAYIDDLRLYYEPYLFAQPDSANLKKIENAMYEANFKGTLDFIAIYIYKYPVREIVRWLSYYRWITPNQITFLSIVSSFAVPLLLALGYWGWAIVIGWAMFIFDSVDGKLARLTVRLSKTAGIIEHATSSPALFLWFFSLGWYFSEGDILNTNLYSNWACWVLMGLYWIDKSINGIFRAKFKYDLYNHSVFDKKFHLIACRRAIIHLILTVGYVIGKPLEGFYFLAGWMVVSFIVHLIRFFWILWLDRSDASAGSSVKSI